MGFTNLTKYVFSYCGLATCSTAWELMLRRISLRTLVYGFLVNRIQIGAFSLVYIFRSNHLDAVVLFLSIHWMYERGSYRVIWNVQDASATGTKLVLYVPVFEWVSSDVQHNFALARGYYITMHCHSPAGK